MLYGQRIEGPTRRPDWFHRWIWNTRDGVTPFVVTIEGFELQHTSWNLDHYAPRHRPRPGDWVFRDLSIDAHRWYVRRRVKRAWDNDSSFRSMFGSKRQAIARILAEEYRPGAPELYQVRPGDRFDRPPETLYVRVPLDWRRRLEALAQELEEASVQPLPQVLEAVAQELDVANRATAARALRRLPQWSVDLRRLAEELAE